MALSDDLMKPATRAKQAEDRATAAKTEARAQLQHDVQDARDSCSTRRSRAHADSLAASPS